MKIFGIKIFEKSERSQKTELEFNPRFSRGYWDNEKSSSYNINLEYHTLTGRYLQSNLIL